MPCDGRAIECGATERIAVSGLGTEDTIDYSDCQVLIGEGHSWLALRREHRNSSKKSFKPWLKERYGVDFGSAQILAATEALDSIPTAITALLDLCRELARGGGLV